METTNQTQNFFVIDDVPPLQTIFAASMPQNLMEKLDQRSIKSKSKSDIAKKLEKAEEYRKLKSHERMHKAEEKEMKLRKAHDFKVQGPMFQKEL